MTSGPRSRSGRSALGPILLGVSLFLWLPGCSSSPPVPSGNPVDVSLHDFGIHTAVAQASGPSIVFHVHNTSPVTHEFVVVRTDLAAGELPLASDGLSVDEDALKSEGEISDVDAGTTGSLALHLPPGHYVFFCNLEGHYLGGMRGVLVVTGDA
jgi:uncharacterized cupredoxin-like copper-binding protein